MHRTLSALLSLALLASLAPFARAADTTQPSSPLDFTVSNIDGQPVDLSQFKGKVVLIVNVASKCGYTPQYKGLESLYQSHKDQGLVILGFPANNFASQEPGSNSQIKQFCTSKYNVTFPMMAKMSVKGDDQAPLYHFLTTSTDFPGPIKWNFTKFLLDRSGRVIARFEPKTTPEDPALTAALTTALAANP